MLYPVPMYTHFSTTTTQPTASSWLKTHTPQQEHYHQRHMNHIHGTDITQPQTRKTIMLQTIHKTPSTTHHTTQNHNEPNIQQTDIAHWQHTRHSAQLDYNTLPITPKLTTQVSVNNQHNPCQPLPRDTHTRGQLSGPVKWKVKADHNHTPDTLTHLKTTQTSYPEARTTHHTFTATPEAHPSKQ